MSDAAPARVVSLISSATETVCALGLGERLVGRSHECDTPSEVTDLPAVTRPKLDPARPSAEIDRQVKDLVGQALSVYDVDGERLRALAPDLIITQDQCEVCAVSLADVEAALAAWVDRPARVLSLKPASLADVWDDLRKVADALGAPDAGEELSAACERRVGALAARTAALPRRTVACLEWLDPLMAAGNWVPELVAAAGGRDVLGRAGEHSGWMEMRALVEADPEVIVTMPCGFDIARTREELPALAGTPEWPRLTAVRAGRVALADGNRYFNRPGPRLADSAEILAEILHPEHVDFGHRGRGWMPCPT